jgi:hypothetical protein
MRHWIPSSVLVLGFAGSVLSASRPAEAATCTADQDCDQGFVCEVVGESGCPGVACPDGQECPEPPPCEPVQYKECVPGPCETAADCADGMICLEHSSTVCTGSAPACSPDAECPAPEPEQCTTTTEKACVPKYVAPCSVDSDCGDGFTCVESLSCACSGSAGSADTPVPPDSGSEPAPAPEPVPPECTCTATGEKHCQIKEMPCTDGSECPTGWSCEQGATSGDCAESSDGQRTCESTMQPNQCMPPYYDLPGGWAAEDGSLTGEPTRGEASGQDDSTNTAPPNAMAATGGGGCQVGYGSAGSATSMLLLMLGLLPLRRLPLRRRQRKA